jgi:chromosome segregation ATPase
VVKKLRRKCENRKLFGTGKPTKRKKSEIQEDVKKLTQESIAVDEAEKALKADLNQLEEGITAKNKDLLGKERDVKDKLERLNSVQSKVEKLQMESAPDSY